MGDIDLKLRKSRIQLFSLLSAFAILFMSSCSSSEDTSQEAVVDESNWDSISALPEGLQPTVLPKAENLNSYTTLRGFAGISPKIGAQTPNVVSGNSDSLSWNPEYCWAAASYALYDANWEIANSEFAKSLGQGWNKVFFDGKKGKTVAFSIFSDLAASDKPLIDILENDLKSCPIAIQKIGDVTWNYEFQVKRDSENALTVIIQMANSQGLVGNSLRSVNQVGRNLLASYLALYDWKGNAPSPVSAGQEKDLVSTWVTMAAKVLAQQNQE